ncbi:uncharacterized protein LOC127790256 isoform X2 [Diospyros lotus]|uniref:uncharacterized protein LOC127790256 isoform X2 n=1 Tax=Diospyros lotus TaxID=55363 RepID=UPI002258910B|nr:uncharacterized protein LOC127790256 isoform X2 [Diospyros lotus]
MPETCALCCFSTSFAASISRAKEAPLSSSSSSSSPLASPHRFSLIRPPRPSSRLVCTAKASSGSGNFSFDDPFGFYPWDSSDGDAAIQWVPEERVTLFTTDGLIQIGGSMVPRHISSSEKMQGKSKASQRLERFRESDYMDPSQGLCLGALFYIAATNGLDMGRRLCILGFCRSIEMLSDVVEDAVLEHGGEDFSVC